MSDVKDHSECEYDYDVCWVCKADGLRADNQALKEALAAMEFVATEAEGQLVTLRETNRALADKLTECGHKIGKLEGQRDARYWDGVKEGQRMGMDLSRAELKQVKRERDEAREMACLEGECGTCHYCEDAVAWNAALGKANAKRDRARRWATAWKRGAIFNRNTGAIAGQSFDRALSALRACREVLVYLSANGAYADSAMFAAALAAADSCLNGDNPQVSAKEDK